MSRAGKWLIITLILVLIVLLFRMKAIAPASVLSFLLFMAGLVERLYRMRAAKAAYDHMKGQGDATRNADMNVQEAKEILGLEGEPSEQEIKTAYKKLMQKNHPDQGGSKYFATQLNRAKDILLKEKK